MKAPHLRKAAMVRTGGTQSLKPTTVALERISESVRLSLLEDPELKS